MPAKKTPAKPKAEPKPAAKVEPFLRCGDCDAKLPVDTAVCPKCGYEL